MPDSLNIQSNRPLQSNNPTNTFSPVPQNNTLSGKKLQTVQAEVEFTTSKALVGLAAISHGSQWALKWGAYAPKTAHFAGRAFGILLTSAALVLAAVQKFYYKD